MKLVTGFFMAWGNFCAIPCPVKKWDDSAQNHKLMMFPFVGLLIGLIWAALYKLLLISPIPVPLTAACMAAYPFLVTGFIHLDGFMDCNDAILSRRPLEKRQQILKDSHVGAFAVIAVVMLMMFMYGGMWSNMAILETENTWCYVMIPVLSRCMSAWALMAYRPMATSSYSNTFDKKETKAYRNALVVITIAATAVLMVAGTGNPGLADTLAIAIMIIAQLAASMISGIYGRKQLGGMNGDIAGYMLVWSELIAILALAVI